MHMAAMERIAQLSVGNASRIAALLQINTFSDREGISKVLGLMEPFTLTIANDKDREILRAALRKTIHWHRNSDHTPAAELDEWMQGVEMFYECLSPVDLILCHRWLFDNSWIELPQRERNDDIHGRGDRLAEYRTKALTEIYQTLGMAGIENLISACSEPSTVGAMLNKGICVDINWANWIIEKGGNFIPGLPITLCIAGLLNAAQPPYSGKLLREVMTLGDKQGWDAVKFARFLVLARRERETWQLAAEWGPSTNAAYWESVQISFFVVREDDDLDFVLQRLLEVKRPRTALQCGQHRLELIGVQRLFFMLQQYLSGDEQDGPMLDSWNLCEML